jgi:hypothetical protein
MWSSSSHLFVGRITTEAIQSLRFRREQLFGRLLRLTDGVRSRLSSCDELFIIMTNGISGLGKGARLTALTRLRQKKNAYSGRETNYCSSFMVVPTTADCRRRKSNRRGSGPTSG